MDKHSQGALEYLMMLAAVILIASSIVYLIHVVSTGLGSNVSGQIDNVMDNVVVPSLVGTLF